MSENAENNPTEEELSRTGDPAATPTAARAGDPESATGDAGRAGNNAAGAGARARDGAEAGAQDNAHAAGDTGAAGGHEDPMAVDPAKMMAAQSRSLRNSVIVLAIFFAIVIALLLAVPGLRDAAERIDAARADWVAVSIGLELFSCAGYVVLFGLVFGMLSPRLVSRLSLSELAVNSVVSVSGLAGIALGAWVLRTRGISVERIAKRSVLIFMLTSAVNVGATAIVGVLMWTGVLPGSQNALLTLLPAAAAVLVIAGTIALAAWARRGAERRLRSRGRMYVALTALSGGVFDALELIRARKDPRLLGAVAYWLFDVGALYVCLLAYGPAPSFWAVAMAYLVGMLANSLPIPAGLVAVEGGLVGMLLLFGIRPASLVLAAVVTYRAVSLWVPALVGSAAFLSIRGELAHPPVAPSPGS